MNNIYKFIEEKLGITETELSGFNRNGESVFARRVFVVLCKKKGFSNSKIARLLKRDHTTVIHHLAKIKEDPQLNETIEKNLVDYKDNEKKEEKEGKVIEKQVILQRIGIGGKYRWLYEKQKGKCVVCGFDEVIEVHHIIPRYLGGTEDPENLVLLCPNHHALVDRGMLFINRIELKEGVDKTDLSAFPQG